MEDDFDLKPEEFETEQALYALKPGLSPIDERALWFEAGIRRGRKLGRRWQVATAASLALAIGSFSWNVQSRQSVVQMPQKQPASLARVPTAPAGLQHASHSTSVDHDGIDELLKGSEWHLQGGGSRQSQSSPAAITDTLSANRMLEHSTNPKDFLTMRS